MPIRLFVLQPITRFSPGCQARWSMGYQQRVAQWMQSASPGENMVAKCSKMTGQILDSHDN
jgi:hypothetical protein